MPPLADGERGHVRGGNGKGGGGALRALTRFLRRSIDCPALLDAQK